MTRRVQGAGTRNMAWDAENRLTSVTEGANTTTFVYDGDGKRVKKTEGGATTIYVNKYYEKTGADITLYYYLGDRLVALKKNGTLRYVVQDHLTSTSTTWDTAANPVASIKYFPFGATRSATGPLDTEIKFTGQRLDAGVDLYYYGARYYDAGIGRFISADTGVQIEAGLRVMSRGLNVSGWSAFPVQRRAPLEPQALNRYSYTLNNPLKYVDPSGEQTVGIGIGFTAGAFGWAVSGSIIYVQSQRGGTGFVWSFGAGGMGGTGWRGGGVSAGAVVQYTTAETVEQLRGWSVQSGGSGGIGAGGGIEYIEGRGYHGVNVTPGAGAGFEMHGILEKAGALILRSEAGGNQATSSGLDSMAGRGAGIIGDFSFSPGSLVGTDEAGNGVVLVSIDGGGPTLVTVDNANSMLREGEDLVYVQP